MTYTGIQKNEGKSVPYEDAYAYAEEKTMASYFALKEFAEWFFYHSDKREKEEFTEWYFSGNWLLEDDMQV